MKKMFNKIMKALLVVSIMFIFAISFLLSSKGQRDVHFWISVVALLLCIIIAFGHPLFSLNMENNKTPVPVIISIDTLISFYGVFVIADILIFWAAFKTTWEIYLTVHLISLFIFIIIGGLLIMYNISASIRVKEASCHLRSISEIKITLEDTKDIMKALKDMDEYKTASDKLEELYDKIRYSDPVSHRGIEDIELEIIGEVNELKDKITGIIAGESDLSLVDITEYINSIIDKAGKRNRVLAALK